MRNPLKNLRRTLPDARDRIGTTARVSFFVLALAISASAATTLYVLDQLTPEISKNPEPGYSASEGVYRFENKSLKCEVEHLNAEARGAYFSKRGYGDPLKGLASENDLFVVRVRIENLLADGNIVMSPASVMFENCTVRDQTHLYQLLYLRPDGEKRLEAAGAVFYLNQLDLPPGTWIERLFLFEYDDPYPTKHMKLVIANLLGGEQQWDLEFPFVAKFRKEKV